MPTIAELALNQGRPAPIDAEVEDAAEFAAFIRFPGRDTDLTDIRECDKYKTVFQKDIAQVWLLTSIDPIIWTPWSGSGVDPTTLHNAIVAALGTDYVKRDGTLAMTGALSFGSNKITSLANGTAASDAAAFGQIPTSIDQLLPAFSIASFTLSGSYYAAVVEVGTTVTLAAAVTYVSGPPTAPTTITDTESGSWTFTTPFASGTRSGTVQKTTHGATLVVTLSATGPAGVKTIASTVTWAARQYWGIGAAGLTAAQVQALGNSQLTVGLFNDFTVSPTNQKVYFMWPRTLGVFETAFTIWHNGLTGAFDSAQSVSITENGTTQLMYLVETTYLQNGIDMRFDRV
jgi:hypothetical protein